MEKEIENAIKSTLNECWGYHKDKLKEYTNKKDLPDYLANIENVGDWDDVYWYAGYLRGLERASEMLQRSDIRQGRNEI